MKITYSLDCTIQNIFRKFGFQIHRIKKSSPIEQITASLNSFAIDLVLDVGANQGQFGRDIRNAGYAGKIASFEPLPAAHTALLAISNNDPGWYIHPRCALGDSNGKIEINISENSVSSSILPMLELHRTSEPKSVYHGKERVPIFTLDTVAGPYLRHAQAPFLKIDTQGYEWQVLEGARAILPNLCGVLLELSLTPLYEGQHLWRDLIDWLEAEGFELWALHPGFSDLKVGRSLQVDGVFYRKALGTKLK